MKLSKNEINEWIKLYLNDLEDYGDNNADLLIAEQTLHSFGKLLLESNQDVPIMLREAISKADPEQREVYENFLEYLENV